MTAKTSNVDCRSAAVCEQRGRAYGDPTDMLNRVSEHWTALLRATFQRPEMPPIPPYVVGLMLAALKLHRAAMPLPKPDRDSYIDMHNYIDFAEQADHTLPLLQDGDDK